MPLVPGEDHDASPDESLHEEGESEVEGPSQVVPSSPLASIASGHVESDVEGKDSEKSSENPYDSDIDKETLCLGEPSPASVTSDENMRDSQVSSGWLGRAYNRESRNAKREQTMTKLAEVRSSKLKIGWLYVSYVLLCCCF